MVGLPGRKRRRGGHTPLDPCPAIGFGIWDAVDFHQAERLAEPLRLVGDLVSSGLAGAGLIAVGQAWWGWAALLALSIVYHLLVYAAGERLLKPRPDRQQPRASGKSAS